MIFLKSYLTTAVIFFSAKKYSDAEAILVYCSKMILSHCEYFSSFMQQGMFPDSITVLPKMLYWMTMWSDISLDNGYLPQFDQYLDFLNQILGLVSSINGAKCYYKISNWKIITCGLRLFSMWLFSIDSEIDESRKNECMTVFRALGEKFVANHLYIDQTTLLHLELVRGGCPLKRLSSLHQGVLLIASLLEWGADAVINSMDIFGRRPIHCVEDRFVFELLVSYGAHPDAVNSFGGSAYDAFNSKGDCKVPLSLTCYAARKIVAEKMPYLTLDLPSSAKNVILLHDKDHAPPMQERSSYHLKDVVYTS